MRFLGRIWDRISLFFRVDVSIWFSELPLIKKILLIAPAVILLPFLCSLLIGLTAIPFILFLCWLNNDVPYEFLRPTADIACVEIICMEDPIGLYSHSIADLPGMLEEAGVPSIDLAESQCSTFFSDFEEVQCNAWWNDPTPYIEGGTILIQYTDGSQEWISAKGTFWYDAVSGKGSMTKYFFSNEDFESFLAKYGYHPS